MITSLIKKGHLKVARQTLYGHICSNFKFFEIKYFSKKKQSRTAIFAAVLSVLDSAIQIVSLPSMFFSL